MQKNYKINILTLKFMSLMGNKSSGTIFGSHACRFQISSALSELNAPLTSNQIYTATVYFLKLVHNFLQGNMKKNLTKQQKKVFSNFRRKHSLEPT